MQAGGEQEAEDGEDTTAVRSPIAVIAAQLRQGGIVGLYQGVAPELIRGVLSTALMLSLKEKIATAAKVSTKGRSPAALLTCPCASSSS